MGASDDLRRRVGEASVLLVFTPELCSGRDPLAVLEALLPWVDLVQVRPKPLGDRARGAPRAASRTTARDAFDWTRRALERVRASADPELPVLVNDRVDVARALAPAGAAGVHVGDEDCPPAIARAELGPDALVGLSTHSLEDVIAAEDAPVDLLGFGPTFATATKGYGAGAAAGAPALVGPERAWVAAETAAVPVFPIGGVDLDNADDLAHVGRAAVAGCLLGAEDPPAAARELRMLLARR